MRVLVIGAQGFVGGAFVRHFRARGEEVVEVTRANYQQTIGTESDVVVEAACNSRKFWAEERPLDEFDASVAHRVRTLSDFPTRIHLHLSSVDVYDNLASPSTTQESSTEIGNASNYGFHKLMAEQLVRRYAARWLILRLAGMVGQGLRKNPIYDVLHRAPLRIHPDSQYQFLPTSAVAEIASALLDRGFFGEVFNVCGSGLISPRKIAAMAGRELNLSHVAENSQPRIVDVNIAKISQYLPVPLTERAVEDFVQTAG